MRHPVKLQVRPVHAVRPSHSPHYNVVRIHKTLRVTPAMAAGVTGKLWEVADSVALAAGLRRRGIITVFVAAAPYSRRRGLCLCRFIRHVAGV
jgi:hypothetical protein